MFFLLVVLMLVGFDGGFYSVFISSMFERMPHLQVDGPDFACNMS